MLGVALGGALAVHFGWRWAFGAMAILGLVLVVLYRLLVSDKKLDAAPRRRRRRTGEPCPDAGARAKLRTLFSTPSVLCAYIGSGLQLFIAGSLFAWLPSYLGRAYGLAPDKAAGVAAVAILFMGARHDRLRRGHRPAEPAPSPIRKWTTAIVYSLASLVFLGVGFSLPPGGAQLLLLAVGVFFAAGTSGPAGAMVANLTPEPIRATALGTLTLANNLLGLAAGPLVVGHARRRRRPRDRHAVRPDRRARCGRDPLRGQARLPREPGDGAVPRGDAVNRSTEARVPERRTPGPARSAPAGPSLQLPVPWNRGVPKTPVIAVRRRVTSLPARSHSHPRFPSFSQDERQWDATVPARARAARITSEREVGVSGSGMARPCRG